MKKIIIILLFLMMLPAGAFSQDKTIPDHDDDHDDDHDHFLLFPIKLFQKYISGADGDRCPMYPSCSQYCKQAFRKNGAILGIIMSCDRLLRCGRDELSVSPIMEHHGVEYQDQRLCNDSVENNDFWFDKP